jgi:hypothetical protein
MPGVCPRRCAFDLVCVGGWVCAAAAAGGGGGVTCVRVCVCSRVRTRMRDCAWLSACVCAYSRMAYSACPQYSSSLHNCWLGSLARIEMRTKPQTYRRYYRYHRHHYQQQQQHHHTIIHLSTAGVVWLELGYERGSESALLYTRPGACCVGMLCLRVALVFPAPCGSCMILESPWRQKCTSGPT